MVLLILCYWCRLLYSVIYSLLVSIVVSVMMVSIIREGRVGSSCGIIVVVSLFSVSVFFLLMMMSFMCVGKVMYSVVNSRGVVCCRVFCYVNRVLKVFWKISR